MEKILISACLMGELCRYDGKQKKLDHHLIRKWETQGRLVPFCPEVAGGLKIPRPPAQIINGDGLDVLENKARVQTSSGEDVTQAFVTGALVALELTRTHGIKIAILKAKSPSCGSDYIYDGTFENRLVPGIGVTTAVFRGNGVDVFSELEIQEVSIRLKRNF